MGVLVLLEVRPPVSPGLRPRIANALVRLGGGIHVALTDLAVCVEPRLGLPINGRFRPWAGLVVVVILLAGVALLVGGPVLAIREAAPCREATP